jgi:hypothetical protein
MRNISICPDVKPCGFAKILNFLGSVSVDDINGGDLGQPAKFISRWLHV